MKTSIKSIHNPTKLKTITSIMKKIPRSFALLAGFTTSVFLATSSLNAATVLSWGGDMVTNHVNLVLPTPVNNGATRTWAYNYNTPLLSTSGSYSGLPIYGALQNFSGQASPANFSVARVQNSGTNDFIRITGNNNRLGETNTISGLLFFKLEVESGQTVSFTDGDSMVITASSSGVLDRKIRMAVLNDGIWYLSATVNSAGFSIANTATALWAVWDPTGAPLNAAPTVFDTLGSTFTNIEAAGIWFNMGLVNDGGSFPQGQIDLKTFAVNATVVPEPSVAAFLVLAALGIVLLNFHRARTRSRCG